MLLLGFPPDARAASADLHTQARQMLNQVEAFRVGRHFAAMESLATIVRTRLESAALDNAADREPALLGEAWGQICVSRVARRLIGDTLVVYAGRRSLELLNQAGDAPDTVRVMVHENLGWVFGRTGKAPEALAEFREALGVTSRHPEWGPGPRTAIQYDLGMALIAVGQVDSALAVLQHGLVERETMRAPNDNYIGDYHAGIATVYQMQEKAADAEAEFMRAIQAHEARLDPNDSRMLNTLSRAAAFEFLRGDYSRAVDYDRRMLQIALAQRPVNTGLLLECRFSLAQALEQLGDTSGARNTYEDIMPGLEGLYGPSNPTVLEAWISLAGASSKLGDPNRALEIYRHIRSIFDADSTLDKLPLAAASENMAQILCDRSPPGRSAGSDSALALALEAEAISRGRGMTGVDLSMGLSALCTQLKLHGLRGDWNDVDRVDASIQEVLDRFALRENNNSDDVWVIRSEVAGMRGRPADAVASALEGARSARRRLTSNIRALSDRQALMLATNISGPLDRLLQLAPGAGTETVRQAWDELIRTRGLVGAEIARRRIPPPSTNAALVRAHAEWVKAEEALARQEVQLASAMHDAAAESLRVVLRADADERERRLIRDASAAHSEFHAEEVGLDRVLGALTPAQSLVGFAQAPDDRGSRRLVAFVAQGGSATLTCVDLGSVDDRAAAIDHWKALLGEPDPRRRSEAECRRLGAAVARAVWTRISAATQGAKTIFLVPEAPVTGLPWGALPLGESEYLVEAGQVLHVLEFERQIVTLREPKAAALGGLLAVGGVDFGRPADGAGAALAALNLRSATAACDSLALNRLEPLPGTAREVIDVKEAWSRGPNASEPATLLDGSSAAEREFKRLAPGRRVIHIATHGLMLAETCDETSRGTRGVGGVAELEPAAHASAAGETKARAQKAGAKPAVHPAPVAAPRPGIPSPWIGRQVFLAFAGAAKARQHTTDEDEGLLTAQEVSTLDLRGAEWVVLSVCHSAAGESWSRQGVLGMERAFHLAGARTVIASQWSIDDAVTRDWMHALYEARAAGAADAGEAMTRAEREILRERRASGLTTHPFYWAAFTANGE
jgi:CHAT domain-containing protein/tetratricopeptide (TPR) repeat protein